VRIESDLQKSMGEELKARDDYRTRGELASSQGDQKTSDLYEHIAGEEQVHHEEFKQRLSEVESRGGSEMANSCGCNTIQAVLQRSKYRTGELEVKYKDPRFEVYSFELGDGIWGTSIDILEEDAFKEAVENYGEKAITDAMEGKEVPVCVPINSISHKYSILNKNGDVLIPSERDLSHMCFSGVITLPDGREVEPDSPDSPLRKMGLI
jgi:rubrerythrin